MATVGFRIIGWRRLTRFFAIQTAFTFLRRLLRFIEFALPFLMFALALLNRRSLPCHIDSVSSDSPASDQYDAAVMPACKPPMAAQPRCEDTAGHLTH